MSAVILVIEIVFGLFMLGVIGLFLVSLLLAWTWAHNQKDRKMSLSLILSAAAVEWGAMVSLAFSHLRRIRIYNETPPLKSKPDNPQQIPVIFVPSFHTGTEVFSLLIWRMKQHYWTNLWPFRWRSFTAQPELLEDELLRFIHLVADRTESKTFRLVSFGTSRPIIARVLNQSALPMTCDKWIAVSAPEGESQTMHFLSTPRLRHCYGEDSIEAMSKQKPDLLIYGLNDSLCYPDNIWGEDILKLGIPDVGHYGASLHSTTVRKSLEELNKL